MKPLIPETLKRDRGAHNYVRQVFNNVKIRICDQNFRKGLETTEIIQTPSSSLKPCNCDTVHEDCENSLKHVHCLQSYDKLTIHLLGNYTVMLACIVM